jgi:cytidylate kinase
MDIVITVGGLHGTGKSTYAKILSEDLELRHTSAGEIFRAMAHAKNISVEELNKVAEADPAIDREIDQRMRSEASIGNVVLDGQLTAWMAGDEADLKILLIAPKEVRINRLAARDGLNLRKTEDKTLGREEVERERYRRYYGIDVSDPSVYDLIVDTNLYPLEEMAKILKKIVRDYIGEITKKGKRLNVPA